MRNRHNKLFEERTLTTNSDSTATKPNYAVRRAVAAIVSLGALAGSAFFVKMAAESFSSPPDELPASCAVKLQPGEGLYDVANRVDPEVASDVNKQNSIVYKIQHTEGNQGKFDLETQAGTNVYLYEALCETADPADLIKN